MNLFFSVLGKLVLDFFVFPRNMHFLTRDLGTSDFYRNNSSLFGDASVIEARKLDHTR